MLPVLGPVLLAVVTFYLGATCHPGGTTTSAFVRGNTTTTYFPAAPVVEALGSAVCGTASGGLTSTTETEKQFAINMTGTARNLACWLSVAPGAGSDATFTVRQNGASPANGLVCAIANTARSCADTSHTIAITAGDVLGLMRTSANAPTASPAGGCYFEVDR